MYVGPHKLNVIWPLYFGLYGLPYTQTIPSYMASLLTLVSASRPIIFVYPGHSTQRERISAEPTILTPTERFSFTIHREVHCPPPPPTTATLEPSGFDTSLGRGGLIHGRIGTVS